MPGILSVPLVESLAAVVPGGSVLTEPSELMVYESDGFTIARNRPAAVVFPQTSVQFAAVTKLLADADVPIVPRGSGTGLTGGCVAYDGGVIISTVKLDRVLSIDLANRVAHVQAGVRNLALSDAVARLPGGEGWHFSPDPSSQRASTLGGNAATNAGGIHVLKDFVTSNHVLAVELVLADGSILSLGSTDGRYESPGPDLVALVCGSEGTLGVITSLWVRLTPRPTAFRTLVGLFASTADACAGVSGVIAEGMLPAALEMLDGKMVEVIESVFNFGFPATTQALVLCEIDGPDALLDPEADRVEAIFQTNHAVSVQRSRNEADRAKLWKARKAAFGAIGTISPSYCTQDACIPRSMLAKVLQRIAGIGQEYGLQITNVFHAGDGNIHPIFLYDDRDPDQVQSVLTAAERMLEYCIDIGGTLTGEHGVGVEKIALMPYQFDAPTLSAFDGVKRSFDSGERINAGKMIPSDKISVRLLHPGRRSPQ